MTDTTQEGSLEQRVPEREFAVLLTKRGAPFLGLVGGLLSGTGESWGKRQLFELQAEADTLESFLDDYGARYNQTYCMLTELVASVRGFSLAGLSLAHLVRRVEGYGVLNAMERDQAREVREDLTRTRIYTQGVLIDLLTAVRAEVTSLGVAHPSGDGRFVKHEAQPVLMRLPRNVGQEAIRDEEQRIAEVSSKYLQACTMLERPGFRRLDDAAAREEVLAKSCGEVHARVFEATVHNLQSTYDTCIKNTVLEAQDGRLPLLRGHISVALHLLEAVTQLTHFMERHESDVRDDAARRRLAELVPREDVSDVCLNLLLHWARHTLLAGRHLAEELLPSYTNLQVLEVELPDGVVLHARPASLIVGIVAHHGTPVEMEIAESTYNAGSILELMVGVGSHPEARKYLFRGDERPLVDIGLLFRHALGERGIDGLPAELSYLTRG